MKDTVRLSHVEVNKVQREVVNSLLKQGLVGQSYIIEQFEQAMSHWIKANYCLAVSSGTMADTIALAVLKRKYPNRNEVIVPALTFIAQINAIYYNHLTPVFVDVNDSMQMDIGEISRKISDKTLCVFPVDLLGKPADYDRLSEFDVPIIEDACEALGSEYNILGMGFRKCGTLGDIGTLSFFPSHTITTGEGGMIVTNNKDYYDTAMMMRNHGRSSSEFRHDVIGFNGKMSSLEAALGFGAIDELDAVVAARRRNYKAFGGKEDAKREKICPHGFPFLAKTEEERDRIRRALKENGIENRTIFSCIPTQEEAYAYLGHGNGEFTAAEEFGNRGLYVPCHQGVTDSDIKNIKGVISEASKEKAV